MEFLHVGLTKRGLIGVFMKFVKGLSILGLAMASQGAWALSGDQSSDVYFSATATCAASIAVVGDADALLNLKGSQANAIILTASIRQDRKLAVSGFAQVNVKSKCGYKITLADMTLAETAGPEAGDNNSFTVQPSLISRGNGISDGDSEAALIEFVTADKSDDVATPAVESTGDNHDIYIREIATHNSSVRGFSARPLTGYVRVTVVEL